MGLWSMLSDGTKRRKWVVVMEFTSWYGLWVVVCSTMHSLNGIRWGKRHLWLMTVEGDESYGFGRSRVDGVV